MLYYTIYMKSLHNNTGYIDVALADDQLLRDFMQFLDVGIKPNRTYALTTPPKAQGKALGTGGIFAVNFADVMAITVVKPGS